MKTKFKIVFWSVISIVVLILIYLIISKLKVKKTAIETNKITVDSSKTTIDDNTASLIVRNLLQAMDQAGTDEATIISNLSGLNKDDLLLIIKKFGIQPYFEDGLDTRGPIAKALTIDFLQDVGDKDLIGWLKCELSGSDLQKVAKIFTDNGIPF